MSHGCVLKAITAVVLEDFDVSEYISSVLISEAEHVGSPKENPSISIFLMREGVKRVTGMDSRTLN
jgi:hypothetical protein